MWRQDRLRGLELAVLDRGPGEPAVRATVRKLATFARYGARIDKDIGRALQALRTLRKRPDAWIDELQDDTCEPGAARAEAETARTNSRRASPNPSFGTSARRNARTNRRAHARTRAGEHGREKCTAEPEPPALDRRQCRCLAALAVGGAPPESVAARVGAAASREACGSGAPWPQMRRASERGDAMGFLSRLFGGGGTGGPGRGRGRGAQRFPDLSRSRSARAASS